MKTLLALAALSSLAVAADAPKAPSIPAKPIAAKGELLFSDDMNGSEHDKRWHRVVDTFAFENGALKGTQTRDKDIPAANGKPEVKAHAAVYGLELPTKDSVVEVKIRFDGCTMMDVEFDDRKYTGSHYGHLCRAQVRLDKVTIMDEREGTQNEEIKALQKDPAKKAEVAKRMAGKIATAANRCLTCEVVRGRVESKPVVAELASDIGATRRTLQGDGDVGLAPR